ncbi:MAG: TIGR04442 family protein [Geobacteraceae bacterium]|nr:TIGR04442 family protein [Geobacteraceae bacterium]
MRKDIRLHGITEQGIEYYVFLAGAEVCERFSYSFGDGERDEARFFSPGNEFVIGKRNISHRGNGGSFCEYMFGIDQPLPDLAKGDVLNRLTMYGAHYAEQSSSLQFTDRTEGCLSYEKIFFDGNAVCNYFFFINSALFSGPLKKQQKELVRILGKTIKRSEAVGKEDENLIIEQILALVQDPKAQLFLFKLINSNHRKYRDLFRKLYYANKKIADQDFSELTELAESLGIDSYQQERIRVDVMYKHRDNKSVVDEYKSILVSCHTRGTINKMENARLTRLKTLAVRTKIPDALFYPLDEMLKKDKWAVTAEEHDYLAEVRQILEGMFLRERNIDNRITSEDMLKLLHAKQLAEENRDHAFEEILLDAGRSCDERIRDGADMALLEEFSSIITYFDRYDSTSSTINKIAFMENIRISEEMIRSFLGSKREFDGLKEGLFEELFVAGLFTNRYLGKYGKNKIKTLIKGLRLVEENRLTISALLEQLLAIDREESLFLLLRDHVRERIRNFYSRYTTRAHQEELKQEVTEELRARKLLADDIPDALFRETILTIKKEAMYLHTILPTIIDEKNVSLREDFLENSGLDRFFVEELEREYCALNCIDPDQLARILRGQG